MLQDLQMRLGKEGEEKIINVSVITWHVILSLGCNGFIFNFHIFHVLMRRDSVVCEVAHFPNALTAVC